MTARNAPLVEAAKDAKLHGALAHLRIQKVISGDETDDVETVWSHLREADRNISAILERVENDEGFYSLLDEPIEPSHVVEMRQSLHDFEAIARATLEDHSQPLPRSESTQRFAAAFDEFLANAERVETALQNRMSTDLQRYRFMSVVLICFVLLWGLLAGMAILRLERQRIAHLSTIASTNETISQKNVELERVLMNQPGASYTYTMPSGHVVPGPEDRIVFVNKEVCEKIWGIPAADVEADSMAIARLVDDPTALDDIAAIIRDATQRILPWHAVWPIRTPDGQRKWLDGRGHPVRQEDGSTVWYSLVVDATEQVEREQELERERELSRHAQKQQSIGRLTGGVAHDFNNLLAVIMGNLELLRDEETDPQKLQMIDAGIGATRRGADLTRNMLAFARKARLEPQPIALNSLVEDICSWAGRTLPSSIEIKVSLAEDLWILEADPSSSEAALLNLILNARDATSGAGTLTIETANVTIEEASADPGKTKLPAGRYVMLAVSDTGHGIPADKHDEVFEPFYTTKQPGAGSGLGLSMIQGFMLQSGGRVQVYSEPGVGTTFKLYFPAMHVPLDDIREEEIISESACIGSAHILLAEDDDEVRKVLFAMIEKSGYRVTAASSGDEALDLFRENPEFDLVLTDIVMPGLLQGTGLSRALREMNPDLPVVFMSGYANEATVHENGLRAEDIRLMKPVQRTSLLNALSKALNKHGTPNTPRPAG
ncbi:ATP-binding protein [Aliiruegeria sabulilitoris]|uniref:ATP-binding protein n=1 Tax=Aliiruegeria sabulilitoris TaxID=1510458 RepID=UPI0018D207BD|nr:ATP-binding protein [Aliiruegeria sabulilitoris]